MTTLLSALAESGSARPAALKVLKAQPPPGAAEALLAVLTDQQVAASEMVPVAQAKREHTLAILQALQPHHDNPAVVRRVSALFKTLEDRDLLWALSSILSESTLGEAAEAQLSALTDPRRDRYLSGITRLLKSPVEEAMHWLRKLCEPERLQTPEGETVVGEILTRIVGNRATPAEPSHLHRYSGFLDLCAELVSNQKFQSTALELLALVGDPRCVPGLLRQLEQSSLQFQPAMSSGAGPEFSKAEDDPYSDKE